MRFNGVHPAEMKASTMNMAVEELPVKAGDEFYLSLTQHIGGAAVPIVSKGQPVRKGELVARASGAVSANIHASVDGTVTAIDKVDYPVYGQTACIVIRAADEQGEYIRSVEAGLPLAEQVKSAGITGMGGAMFPTHIKLSPKGKIHTLIINGAECEPYLTCDYRMMLERTADLVKGALLIQKALGIERVIFGVESNKADAAERIRQEGAGKVEVMILPSVYPQGGERQLILSVTGKEVPEGALPAAVSVLVHNVSTVIAVYDAAEKGLPLIQRVVTVSGGVRNPKNILSPLGTPVSRLIDFCGGAAKELYKVVLGGPMTGFTVHSLKVPVYKGMNGVLLLGEDVAAPAVQRPCIRCGRCIRACPSGLSPVMLENLAAAKMYEALARWKLLSCIECSVCNYVCPSARPLKTLFRVAKKQTSQIQFP